MSRDEVVVAGQREVVLSPRDEAIAGRAALAADDKAARLRPKGTKGASVKLWDDDIDALRPQIQAETRAFVEQMATPPAQGTDADRIAARRKAESAWAFPSERAVDRWIAGPSGDIRLREFRPAEPKAAMLHIHGGGWTAGSPEMTDPLNQALSDHLNLAIVSVDYRLAPECPHPAGADDCERAAMWLVEHCDSEYGVDRLLIGGESAGAHLTAVTLLRLRDRHEAADRFVGANLVFGAYDLTRTPSARRATPPGVDILDPDEIAWVTGLFTDGMPDDQRRAPDVSPLFADLAGMPRALFTVGTADRLLDDTLFMASRWVAAGNDAELLVYPDAPHACMGVPTVMNHWWPRLEAFLTGCIAD